HQPNNIGVPFTKAGPFILVAGQTAALLLPLPPKDGTQVKGKLPTFSIVSFDLGDGNHLRFVDEESPLVSRRFGGFYALNLPPAKTNPRSSCPDLMGPSAIVGLYAINWEAPTAGLFARRK